jgi:hypothetical protein
VRRRVVPSKPRKDKPPTIRQSPTYACSRSIQSSE